MVWLKKVWWMCLLAIAGGGPLPLWLHQAICHGEHLRCAGHFPGDSSGCSNGHSQGHQSTHSLATCGHVHTQATHPQTAVREQAPQPNSSCLSRSSDLPRSNELPRYSGTHDECAACYFLSQLTIPVSLSHSLASDPLVLPRGCLPDERCACDLWPAYSSRGPPVC